MALFLYNLHLKDYEHFKSQFCKLNSSNQNRVLHQKLQSRDNFITVCANRFLWSSWTDYVEWGLVFEQVVWDCVFNRQPTTLCWEVQEWHNYSTVIVLRKSKFQHRNCLVFKGYKSWWSKLLSLFSNFEDALTWVQKCFYTTRCTVNSEEILAELNYTSCFRNWELIQHT